MSLGELKEESAKKQNPVQAVVKALSDVFIGIMPALLAAALLMGLTGVLGGLEVVQKYDTLYAINKLVSLASNGIFSILPMAVCYSATKRFGRNPVLGMVVGAIMLDGSLANAYQAAQGLAQPEIISLFGSKMELVGFQGGIIIALMMGYVVAKLDVFFNKKIPDVIKLLVAPLLTVFISTVLLFTIIGPVGRILSNGITDAMAWGTKLWGHYTTTDWIHFQECEPFLFPDCDWDRDGVYSGSAFVDGDKIHYFYTGNVKLQDKDYDYILEGREQNTIHLVSEDGMHAGEKQLVMTNADYPADMSKHVRDPKIFVKNGRYYMVQGARDCESKGCVLLFESDGQEILIACPQGF